MDFHRMMIFNQGLQGPAGSIIGAILIFLLGWVAALVLAAATRKALNKFNINGRIQRSTGTHYQVDQILSKLVFWFVFIIGISGALNQVNLNSISVPLPI